MPGVRTDVGIAEYAMKEGENLWKATAQAALIGIAGMAAMLATEVLLFSELESSRSSSPGVETSGSRTAPAKPAG